MTSAWNVPEKTPGRRNGSGVDYQTAQHRQRSKAAHGVPTATAADFIRAFGEVLVATGLGLPPDGIRADGQLHRYRGAGDKPGSQDAWYVLYLDGHPAGAFGSWRTTLHETWRADGDFLTREQADRFAAQLSRAQALARAEREELQASAARRARYLWGLADEASPSHPYLIRKAVRPLNLRQAGPLLLVPLIDTTGTLWNLQTIAPDGTKRFQRGGRITGLHSLIGNPGEAPACLLICEGWATGATLHMETGNLVLCAMNCGNLRAVAMAARARWPDADIVVCGDDDRHTEGNPGRAKATEAAAAIGGRLSFPTFRPGEQGTDFNDMASLRRRVAA